MPVFDRSRIENAAKASPVRDEVREALADPLVMTLEGFFRRLFLGAPNTGVDNGFVVERFDVARTVLGHQMSDQQLIADGAPALRRPSAAAAAFISAELPEISQSEASEAADFVFRFVDGSLHVPGNFELSGPLLIAGDLSVDGVIVSHGHRVLMVMGDVRCRALDCVRSHVLIEGSLSASELVFLDDIAEAQIAGNLLTPAVLTHEGSCSGLIVGGDNCALDVNMDDAHAAALFEDGVIGTEEAQLSWHVMREVKRGKSVWRKVPGSA